MEVFFLDVGQGTCQVILLGGQRAIVIDCGMPDDVFVVQFLQRMRIEVINCLIVSHSHDDHMGGAVTILGEYQDRIERICFVQDSEFLETRFWARLSVLLKSGRLRTDQVIRLEVADGPQLLWSDVTKDALLKTYSPSGAENLLAQVSGQQNATSAVLFLDVQSGRIVFAADSEIPQWREIHRKYGKTKCDIIAVPHHAGRMHNTPDDLAWFLEAGITAKAAVISVGTSNIHRHPRLDVVRGLTFAGAKVFCTQITSRCANSLEPLRPGVLKPVIHPGKSSPAKDLTSGRNSRNVACAGTVCAVLTSSGFDIERGADHQTAVDKLAASPSCSPLCRG